MGTLVLLDLMGGAALLLWGLHMVQSGILRAFGPDLRNVLSKALRNRIAAFGAGFGLTALLQSSTATGLMTVSFAAEGMVALVPALAIMLGANVGTTLIVQLLSFNVAAAAPVLFIIGLVAFRSGARTRIRDLGRRLDRHGADTACPSHPDRQPRARRECARRPRRVPGHHGRSRSLRRDCGGSHLGRPFQCRDRPLHHVARLFQLRHSNGRARTGARRQPRQRDQSGVRRHATRRSGELPCAARQLTQPPDRSRAGRAVSARDHFVLPRHSAGHGEDDRAVPHRLQCGACARLPAAPWSDGETVGVASPRQAAGRGHLQAAISRRKRARNTIACAGGCRTRDATPRRFRRGHAAAGDEGPDERRPRPRKRGLAHGQHRRQARRGDQALRSPN